MTDWARMRRCPTCHAEPGEGCLWVTGWVIDPYDELPTRRVRTYTGKAHAKRTTERHTP